MYKMGIFMNDKDWQNSGLNEDKWTKGKLYKEKPESKVQGHRVKKEQEDDIEEEVLNTALSSAQEKKPKLLERSASYIRLSEEEKEPAWHETGFTEEERTEEERAERRRFSPKKALVAIYKISLNVFHAGVEKAKAGYEVLQKYSRRIFQREEVQEESSVDLEEEVQEEKAPLSEEEKMQLEERAKEYVAPPELSESGEVRTIKMEFDKVPSPKKGSTKIYETLLTFPNIKKAFVNLAPDKPLDMRIPEDTPSMKLIVDKEKQTFSKDNQEDIHEYMGDEKTTLAIASGYLKTSYSKRYGDPIADFMLCQRFQGNEGEEIIVFSGADGSGWVGNEGSNSGQIATLQFAETIALKLKQDEGIKTAKDATSALISGVEEAHQAIVDDSQIENGIGGLTTHLGFFGKVDQEGQFKGALSTVGDMKLFILRKDGQVDEVTYGNRGNAISPSDPGGQLGTAKGALALDLRNLTVYFFEGEKGDILLPMSDGIHDNLDPKYIGKANPQEALDELINNPTLSEKDKEALNAIKDALPDNWGEDTPQVALLKGIYQKYKLKEIIDNKRQDEPISSALVRHAYELTSAKREFMEKNPFKKDSDGPKIGKADHFSCAAITI